jgi:hypothetical protein
MAGTTTNFGFDYPTSTDYVKDGATAIQELADDVDARFGDDANYPDQIVNVVSGVSRPVAYAMAAGTGTATFTAAASSSVAVTFPASRFTEAPIVTCAFQQLTGGGQFWVHRIDAPTTSGTTFRLSTYNAANITATVKVNFVATQMTSAASAG